MDQVKFFEKLLELVKEKKIGLKYISYGGTQDFNIFEQGPMHIFSRPSGPSTVEIDLTLSIKDNVLKESLMDSIIGDTKTKPQMY